MVCDRTIVRALPLGGGPGGLVGDVLLMKVGHEKVGKPIKTWSDKDFTSTSAERKLNERE